MIVNNANKNKKVNIFYEQPFYICKTNSFIGEKYLRKLIKYIGAIPKKKSIKKLSNNKFFKKSKIHKKKEK